jgi:hypothetical protein
MIADQLAEAMERRFPGRQPNEHGLASLAADYDVHGGAQRIGDLYDWLVRRARYFHPAYGLPIRERRLRGPQAKGCGAAEIGTAQGADGRWYARHAYQIAGSGVATPITHSPPHESEAAAIAWAATEIKDRVAGQTWSSSAGVLVVKIEAWCREQIGAQGELAL